MIENDDDEEMYEPRPMPQHHQPKSDDLDSAKDV